MLDKIVTGKVAALVAAVVFAVIAFSGKPVIATDTPFYLSIADGLQSHPLDVLLAKDRVRVTVLTLPVVLIVARSVAPDHWAWVVVAINVLCLAVAAGLLVALVRAVTGSALAALAAFLFYVTAHDLTAWLRFVLTDNLFVLTATFVLYVLIIGIVRDDTSVRRRVRLGLALLAAFVTRATGAVLIPVALFAEWWSHRGDPRGRASRIAPWALVLLVFVAAMWVRASFFADIRRWPSDFLRPMLEEYAAREKTGEVVYDRVESRRTPPVSALDHFVLQTDRFIRFFQFRTQGFSRAHNLVNTAYYVPLYALALLGLIDGLRGGDWKRKRIVVVTALWILSLAWLHALTILDFDWRHRQPAMPMLILLAACGVEAAVRRYRLRVRSMTYNGRALT